MDSLKPAMKSGGSKQKGRQSVKFTGSELQVSAGTPFSWRGVLIPKRKYLGYLLTSFFPLYVYQITKMMITPKTRLPVTLNAFLDL